jgi:hypothetical protein
MKSSVPYSFVDLMRVSVVLAGLKCLFEGLSINNERIVESSNKLVYLA